MIGMFLQFPTPYSNGCASLAPLFRLISGVLVSEILYFPKSTSNFTHGLLIGDLFSLYVSFYPMKNKGSAEVARCFRAYFAAQGVPKSVYTDSDPSFRGNTETLFRTYNVTHVTSYPYTQLEIAGSGPARVAISG